VSIRLALLAALGLLTGVLVTGCGSGDRTAGPLTTALTGTHSISLLERTETAEEAAEPVTGTETQLAETEPAASETTPALVTVVETQTIVEAGPPAAAATSATTTAGLNPVAVAGTAAVVASTTEEESGGTDWGWVAFGVLAAAVLVFGAVGLWHRRRGGGTPASAGSGG
jgi:hypothetical protein